MTASTRPWAATLTAKLVRARDVDTMEVIEVRHGQFIRRMVGDRGPVASPTEILDAGARRELLAELQQELEDPPGDVDAVDIAEFVGMLQRSLTEQAAAVG